MKKCITIVIVLLVQSIALSQLITSSFDINGKQVLTFDDTAGILLFSYTEDSVYLEIDLDAEGTKYKEHKTLYAVNEIKVTKDDLGNDLVLIFDILPITLSPDKIEFDLQKMCVHFWYSDGTSLIYTGAGIKIIS